MIISHLGTLQSRIRQSEWHSEAARRDSIEFLLEQLPYALSGSIHFAAILMDEQADAVARFAPAAKADTLSGQQLPEEARQRMAFAVDAYLDAARRTQNALCPYISKVLKVSSPISLSKLMDRVEKRSIMLPTRVEALLQGYWQMSGRRLKHYRDLSQHFAVAASEARVITAPDGTRQIFLTLPNNPEVKEHRKLSYRTPVVDAAVYVWESLEQLVAFVFELTHVLLSFTEHTALEIATLSWKGGMSFGADVNGHLASSGHLLRTEISRLVGKLRGRLDAELPRVDIKPTLLLPEQFKSDLGDLW